MKDHNCAACAFVSCIPFGDVFLLPLCFCSGSFSSCSLTNDLLLLFCMFFFLFCFCNRKRLEMEGVTLLWLSRGRSRCRNKQHPVSQVRLRSDVRLATIWKFEKGTGTQQQAWQNFSSPAVAYRQRRAVSSHLLPLLFCQPLLVAKPERQKRRLHLIVVACSEFSPRCKCRCPTLFHWTFQACFLSYLPGIGSKRVFEMSAEGVHVALINLSKTK